LPRKHRKIVLISVHVPEEQVRALDELVKCGLYPNRSEAIRKAIQDLIEKHRKRSKSAQGAYLSIGIFH